jgi:hypothetical protein
MAKSYLFRNLLSVLDIPLFSISNPSRYPALFNIQPFSEEPNTIMEALVAVGLAGNVAQFVSAAGALIKEANSIRKEGGPSSLPKLKNLSEDLMNQAAVLRTRLKASNATLAEEDQVRGPRKYPYLVAV